MAWLRVFASVSVLMLIVSPSSPQLFGSDGVQIPTLQQGNDAVVNTVNSIFGALRIPLNVRNPFRRNTDRSASGIGNSCRTTVECVAQSPNSVCYDGRCLCNLGYHYVAKVDQCIKDNVCPSCDNPVNTCIGGQDVYCNGSCFADYRVEAAEKAKKQVNSPNWPNDYKPNTDKFVCVQANTGKRVHLDLIWIDLETGCGHSCDYIKVYDGCVADDSSNLLAFYTGDNAGNRQQVTSNCNKMMIHFHSDQDDQGSSPAAGGRAKREVTADNKEVAADDSRALATAENADEPVPVPVIIDDAKLEQQPKTLEKFLQRQQELAAQSDKPKYDQDYSKDQRSGFMGYYREIDYDEKVCACANP